MARSGTVGYYLLLWIVISYVFTNQCSASGIFELDILRFRNNFGLDNNNECCMGSRTHHPCDQPCNTNFRICLKQFQHQVTPDSCTYGSKITIPLGNNSFDIPSQLGRVSIPFAFQWTVNFSVIVEAHRFPGPASEQTLLHRDMTSGSAPGGGPWIPFESAKNGKEMDFRYRVVCTKNRYGPSCNRVCSPRNDNVGHYSCDANGSKTCLQGWTGLTCTDPICLEGCDNGYCERPNDCMCKPGWKGPHCDECIPARGCQKGTCREPNDCLCLPGWGGGLCNQDLNYCARNRPCLNNGICTNTGSGSYNCSCPEGFTGRDCEVSSFNCHQQPCLNGGSCLTNPNNGLTHCSCPRGTTGHRCETGQPLVPCTATSCQNGGTCAFLGTAQSRCQCSPGWAGASCTEIRRPCEDSPCLNGGSCRNVGTTAYECTCTEGFRGHQCDERQVYCSDGPCQNGGTCLPRLDSTTRKYECRCMGGYFGVNCQSLVNYCVVNPCANGGSCMSVTNGYQCECMANWGGERCESPRNPCESLPCLNGGTCTNTGGTYSCKCASNFAGLRCEWNWNQLTHNPSTQRPAFNESPVPPLTAGGGAAPPSMEANNQAELSADHTIILGVSVGAAGTAGLLLLTFCLLKRRQTREARQRADAKDLPRPSTGPGNLKNNEKAAALFSSAAAEEGTVVPPSSVISVGSDQILNPISQNEAQGQRAKTVVKKTFNDLAGLNRENSQRTELYQEKETLSSSGGKSFKSMPAQPLNPALLAKPEERDWCSSDTTKERCPSPPLHLADDAAQCSGKSSLNQATLV